MAGRGVTPDKEDVYKDLERWLKERRDEHSVAGAGEAEYRVLDGLLDEVRDAGAEGCFPWEVES